MKGKSVLEILARETDAKRYNTHRYCFDTFKTSVIEYDDDREIEWKDYGETDKPNKPINLKRRAQKIVTQKPIFSYFLDGSRKTYKVDDVSYSKEVLPIIAGQVGVGCLLRTEEKTMKRELMDRQNVIVLPHKANFSEWDNEIYLKELCEKINSEERKHKKINLNFDAILTYQTSKDKSPENKGIAVVQDYMIELEKENVAKLVANKKLDQNNWLIKDGSLEYKAVKRAKKDVNDLRIRNNYKYVIGVSKSFNPSKLKVKSGRSNSDFVANLQMFERTPAYMYCSAIAGNIHLAIWFIRIRQPKYTRNIFDGIIKVEKIVIDPTEIEHGLDSDLVDHISANLLNERNPVCYGKDSRWANHLYPIHLTESFVKSQYVSNDLFLQLF